MTSSRKLCEWLFVSFLKAPTQHLEAGKDPAQYTVGAALGLPMFSLGKDSQAARTLKIRTEKEDSSTAELQVQEGLLITGITLIRRNKSPEQTSKRVFLGYGLFPFSLQDACLCPLTSEAFPEIHPKPICCGPFVADDPMLPLS